MQFARQLLARGNAVHATARKPEEAKQLQDLKTKDLTIAALDTSDPNAIRQWAAQLKGQRKFDVRNELQRSSGISC